MPPEGEFVAAAPPADFGAADSAMILEKYLSGIGNCFQLKADLGTFYFSPVLPAAHHENRRATTDCGARLASIFVQTTEKQAGSFIALHL
jgi:hypothetical protein